MEELKKMLEELGRAFEEYKKINDQRMAEIKANGSASASTEEKLAKADADIARLTKARDDLQKQIDEMKTVMSRPGTGASSGQEAERKAAQQKAFDKYMRQGKEGLNADEVKLLSTDDGPNGGFLVREEVSGKVIEKVYESSPIFQLADVISISGKSISLAADLDEAGAEWGGEQESPNTTTTPTWKEIEIVAHELRAKPKATQVMLEDARFDIEAWLSKKVSDKFSRTAATAFVSGNGIKKPRGFLTYSSGTSFGTIEQVVSGSAAALTAELGTSSSPRTSRIGLVPARSCHR